MGKAVSAVKKVAPTVMTGGLNKVGEKLGLSLGDKEGESNQEQDLQSYLRQRDPNVDPITGMDNATKYIQGNALTKGVYGEGGLQSQLGTEGKNLADTGFQLTQGDREAYGQTSGDIGRLFGQQEQSTAAALARRGLGSAASGAAGAAFSGLAGNKNEMLAKAQTDIAQKRMKDTQSRLMQNRQMQMDMAGQGRGMAQQQYGNAVNARQQRIGELSELEGSKSRAIDAANAARKEGLFSTIGKGLQAGVGQLATQAPGMALGGATGGNFGTASNQQKAMFAASG